MRGIWSRKMTKGGFAFLLVAVGVTGALSGVLQASGTGEQDQLGQMPVPLRVMGQASARIGVSVRDIENASDGSAEGAVVVDVGEESPAETAGIAGGDVIVEFDGERVRGAQQLSRLVSETPAGRSVLAVVLRDDQRVELQVTPDEGGRAMRAYVGRALREADRIGRDLSLAIPGIPSYGAFRQPGRLGIEVDELTSQLADYFGVDAGVLVTMVRADTVAEAAGLLAGDIITAVDGRPVTEVGELRRRIGDVENGEESSITVTRERSQVSLTARFEDRDRPRRRPQRPI